MSLENRPSAAPIGDSRPYAVIDLGKGGGGFFCFFFLGGAGGSPWPLSRHPWHNLTVRPRGWGAAIWAGAGRIQAQSSGPIFLEVSRSYGVAGRGSLVFRNSCTPSPARAFASTT